MYVLSPDYGRADDDSDWPPVPTGAPHSRLDYMYRTPLRQCTEKERARRNNCQDGRATWCDRLFMVLGAGGRGGLTEGRDLVVYEQVKI